jgi:coenzyme F420-reducing hydrogenase delta subunit
MERVTRMSVDPAHIAIFFCQQLDPYQDITRRELEQEFGDMLVFYPVPCSGKVDERHLMGALEAGAEKVYLVTCPVGACRYHDGNVRARQRLEHAQHLIADIGLDPQRLELVISDTAIPGRIPDIIKPVLLRNSKGG